MKHANTFSHTVSHHFGSPSSGNEWILCFTDKLTHLWRRWGNSGCFKLCTTSCRKTWVNKALFFQKALEGEPGLPYVGNKLLYQVKTNPHKSCSSFCWVGKTNSGKEVTPKEPFLKIFLPCAFHGCVQKKRACSLRMGCILLVPQGALHHVVQQQGAAPADQRRRCPERSGSSLGSGWPVAVQKRRRGRCGF